jgi:hypothetical protein
MAPFLLSPLSPHGVWLWEKMHTEMGDKNTERRLMNHPFNNLCLKAFLTVTLLAF